MDDKKRQKALNNILAFLHDSQVCYQDHIDHVSNQQLRKLFASIAQSRAAMIKSLQQIMKACNWGYADSGTLLGQSHRLYENMKAVVTEGDPLVIAKEVRRGESILIQYYQEAIRLGFSPDIQSTLVAHLHEIEEDLNAVDQLSPLV